MALLAGMAAARAGAGLGPARRRRRASVSRRRCRSRPGWCSPSTPSSASCSRNCEARWALAGLGAAAVLLALVFPGTPLHATASPWLPLHWALGIASYGLFAAAVVHAWLMTRAEKQIRQAADPHAGVPLLTLERLTFRFATAGFVLLSATLLAGLFFSEIALRPRQRGEVGPQDGVLGAGLAGVRLPAAGPRALRLARPQGRARALRRARCCCCWPMWARASCSKWC